jgi:hypothetical protein
MQLDIKVNTLTKVRHQLHLKEAELENKVKELE